MAFSTHRRAWIVGLVVVVGLAMRGAFLPFESGDYHLFLKHWVNFVASNGGFLALRHNFANYTQPYLYLLVVGSWLLPFLPDVVVIKLISIVFDLLCAVLIWRIVEMRRPQSLVAVLAFAAGWLSPTVVLNSAAWGQVDAMYTAFLLLAIYLLMKERPALGIAVYGMAFAIKLQSIFLIPLVVVVVLRSRIRYLAWIVVVFIALMLPAIALGKPVLDALFTYGLQVGTVERLTMGAPNWYQWLPPGDTPLAWWVGMTLGVVLVAAIVLCARRWQMAWQEQVLLMAAWALAGVPFVLPRMHERYFYPAELVAIAFSFTYLPKRPAWLLAPTGLILGSLCAYVAYLGKIEPIPPALQAVPMALVVLALTGKGIAEARVRAAPNAWRTAVEGVFPLRWGREWVAMAGIAVGLVAAALVGHTVASNEIAANRSAILALDDTRVSVERLVAYRCEGRIQVEVTWAELTNFSRLSAVSEMTHLYGPDGRRVSVADGYPDGGRLPFNMLPQSFAEVRRAPTPNPADVSEVRIGLYVVEGVRSFSASRSDGGAWPDGAVVVGVREARPGECDR